MSPNWSSLLLSHTAIWASPKELVTVTYMYHEPSIADCYVNMNALVVLVTFIFSKSNHLIYYTPFDGGTCGLALFDFTQE